MCHIVNLRCLCTSCCVLWRIFSDYFSFLPFWFCHLTCGCCVTLLFSVCIVCRLEIFVPCVLSFQSLTLGTRSVIHTFLLNIVSCTGHQCLFVVYLNTYGLYAPINFVAKMVLYCLVLSPLQWQDTIKAQVFNTSWSPVTSLHQQVLLEKITCAWC